MAQLTTEVQEKAAMTVPMLNVKEARLLRIGECGEGKVYFRGERKCTGFFLLEKLFAR
jgi:hypothetical protein